MSKQGVTLIRSRIARGYMPENLDQLLEERGSLEEAARDLAKFAGLPYQTTLAALRDVYVKEDS